jgi:endoglucanase
MIQSNQDKCSFHLPFTSAYRLAVLLLCTCLFGSGTNLVEAWDTIKPLLPNGNFETAKDQWPEHWQRPKVGVRYMEENGNHFLRLIATEPGTTVLLYRSVNIPADVKALKLSWRQRVTDLKPGKQPWFDARIMLDCKDASGNKLKAGPAAPYTRKSTDGWVERKAEFLVPKGTRTLELMPTLFQVEKGTFDLDDVALVPIDPAALEQAAAAKEAKQTKAVMERRAKAAAFLQANGSLIPNGTLEIDAKKDGWPDQWGKAKGASYEVEEGNHFLRLTASKPGEMVMLYQQMDLPAEVKALELTWRQRITGLKTGKFPWFDARILIEFKDGAGQTMKDKPAPPYTQKSTNGWVERRTKFLVPSEALTVVLMPTLFQVEKGVFDLDDFTLRPIDAEPLIAAAKAVAEADQRAVVPPEMPDPTKWPPELHVEGRRVLDKAGKEVWLQGVNAGGLETLPHDRHVMKSAVVGVDDWKANIIRLPVKDDLWFGRSPYQKDGGKAYREKIDQIVTLVANRRAYLLLDLHRFRAPKAEHVEFWKDAAARYKNHPAVLFDLFNEPHGISWEVWRDGGFVEERKSKADEDAFLSKEDKAKSKQGFQSPGMQALVDAVRSTGARNIVVAGGLSWAADLSGIAKGTVLVDKSGNGIIYAWHIYNWHTDWQGKVLGAAEKYPILVGEVGADAKKLDFIPAAAQEDPYTWVPDMLGFIQKHKLHWTGWCLHPAAAPVMISDWNYTPTPFWGAFAKRALAGEQFEMKKMR